MAIKPNEWLSTLNTHSSLNVTKLTKEEPMSNPVSNVFDNDSLEFIVLINSQQQHSLWPFFKTIPQGWESTFGPSSRDSCLSYVETHWTDIRPQNQSSLVRDC